jgi:hypothetical protein
MRKFCLTLVRRNEVSLFLIVPPLLGEASRCEFSVLTRRATQKFWTTSYIRTGFVYPPNLAIYPNRVRIYIPLVEHLQSLSPPFIHKLSRGLIIFHRVLLLTLHEYISLLFLNFYGKAIPEYTVYQFRTFLTG